MSSVSSASHCPVELHQLTETLPKLFPLQECRNCCWPTNCLSDWEEMFNVPGKNTEIQPFRYQHQSVLLREVKRKPTPKKKSKAKLAFFSFQRHLIKKQDFLQKFSIWLGVYSFLSQRLVIWRLLIFIIFPSLCSMNKGKSSFLFLFFESEVGEKKKAKFWWFIGIQVHFQGMFPRNKGMII